MVEAEVWKGGHGFSSWIRFGESVFRLRDGKKGEVVQSLQTAAPN